MEDSGVTASNDISKTNKPAALSRNQTPTQGRHTNLLPPPGTKPLPKVVKHLLPSPGTKPLPKLVIQTCCPLQEPNPYPRSSNKPAALSRNQTQTHTQGHQTNLLPSPGTKPIPIPKVVKPAALSRNQTHTHTQGRQTNLLHSPGTKSRPIPKVVKQTCCPLQEPNAYPYPRSSKKPAALSRNQTHTQGHQTNLLPSPGTKPIPISKVVKQTCCTLQEPNPYPRS